MNVLFSLVMVWPLSMCCCGVSPWWWGYPSWSYPYYGYGYGGGWGYGPSYSYSYPYAYPYSHPYRRDPYYEDDQVYAERGDGARTSDGYWYYCESKRGYYPRIAECPEDWIRVPPTSD